MLYHSSSPTNTHSNKIHATHHKYSFTPRLKWRILKVTKSAHGDHMSTFWTAHSSKNKNPSVEVEYTSPEDLWEACCEYFQWCEDNPIDLSVHTFSQGTLTKGDVEKPRAMSLSAMCRFIGISQNEWKKIKLGYPNWSRTMQMAEEVITTQLYEYGAADVINANFIARAIGLADKNQLVGAGANGEHLMVNSLDVSNLSLEQLEALEVALMATVAGPPVPKGDA